MTARDQIQLAAELALARSQIEDAQAGLKRFADLGAILALGEGKWPLVHRARWHLQQAAELIASVQDPAWLPAAPPSLADHISEARKQVGSAAPRGPSGNNGCNVTLPPSAQDASAASSTLSPSPESEKENMGSDSADAGEGDSHSQSHPVNLVNPVQ